MPVSLSAAVRDAGAHSTVRLPQILSGGNRKPKGQRMPHAFYRRDRRRRSMYLISNFVGLRTRLSDFVNAKERACNARMFNKYGIHHRIR
jgi:hypothetical protein